MEIITLDIGTVRKSPQDFITRIPQALGGWFSVIRESVTGAWQRSVRVPAAEIMTFSTVWACVTLISSDIGKLVVDLIEADANGIWAPTISSAFSPVLRRPNHYQNRIQFITNWISSKLTNGNTYVLKERDGKNNVVAMYIMDPWRVKPLVAPNGEVFYQLSQDTLSGIDSVTVPASEIIQDVMFALYHPLCGLSPITACALAATQGIKIQENSAKFFANGSNPGGILTAPGTIGPEAAATLKKNWEDNYSGENNIGKVAVLGGGLKYEAMTIGARDSELAKQLEMSSLMVCSAFHMPAFMVGVGQMPTFANSEPLIQLYYSQCLQSLIESLELCLDEGLSLPDKYGIQLDLDGLFRMGMGALIKEEVEAVGGGIKKPNESRKRLNLPPVDGGDTPYMQQQQWPLHMLATRRDTPTPPVPLPSSITPAAPGSDDSGNAKTILSAIYHAALFEEKEAA